jgi:hypothetical protein
MVDDPQTYCDDDFDGIDLKIFKAQRPSTTKG